MGGGVGVVNLLQLHYAMISPTERKQQEEKNSSHFLSTPKLVYYVYLMALHNEAVRP